MIIYLPPYHWYPVWFCFIGTWFFLHVLNAAWLWAYNSTPGEDLLKWVISKFKRS